MHQEVSPKCRVLPFPFLNIIGSFILQSRCQTSFTSPLWFTFCFFFKYPTDILLRFYMFVFQLICVLFENDD